MILNGGMRGDDTTPGSSPDLPIDPATGWVAEHVRSYVETGGERGHHWRGLPILLLTTRGRRSGLWRRTALIYGRDGDAHLVVGSTSGADAHPAWYLNLDAEPDVRVQVGAEVFRARARTATDEEKPRLWATMAEIFPTYETYRKKTARSIPVVVLDRV